jgi:MFS family permease
MHSDGGVGFLLGGMVGLLSFVLRRTLAETNEYAQAIGARHREPLAVLFRNHFAPLTTGTGASLLAGASGGIFIGFAPSYLQRLQYDTHQIASAQMWYLVVVAACILVTSHVGDLLPRRYVFRSGTVLSALFAPFFFIAAARHYVSLPALFLMAGVVSSFANGTFACAIAEMFPVDVRFSGVATSMNLGLSASLGLTPLAANFLVSGLHWMPAPALVIVLCSALAFAASFGMKRERRRFDVVAVNRNSRWQERR